MAVGAIFGAENTMYAAVSSRIPEIAVLLTLGVRPRSVFAVVRGMLGGFFPARRASKLPVVQALR